MVNNKTSKKSRKVKSSRAKSNKTAKKTAKGLRTMHEVIDKPIADSMTKKVTTHFPDTPLSTVAASMAKKNISCVVVVDKKRPKKLIGIVTERDFVKKIVSKPSMVKNFEKLTAKDVMTSPVKCVHPHELVVPIAKLMRNNNSRRFPVVDKTGLLVGIATETDVLDALIRLVKHLNWNLVDKLLTMKNALEQYVDELRENNIL